MSITRSLSSISNKIKEEDGSDEIRRGPWTLEEDNLLIRHISFHGEGRWNSLAKHSGLMRTGKSCRLRWLNYLKPDVKRGNLTPQEQLLILQLHSKWGNRWSKIALHLPGRTDNEIKNYWRTRVQKQARLLKIDSSSAAFQEVIRCIWMPRLLQKINGSSPQDELLPPEHHHHSLSNPDRQLQNSSSDNSIDCWSDQSVNINKSLAFEKTDQPMLCDRLYDERESMNQVLSAAPPSPDFHVADSNWIIDDDVAYGSWNTDELWAFQDGGVTLKN